MAKNLLSDGLRWLAEWIERNNTTNPRFIALPLWQKILWICAPTLVGITLLLGWRVWMWALG